MMSTRFAIICLTFLCLLTQYGVAAAQKSTIARRGAGSSTPSIPGLPTIFDQLPFYVPSRASPPGAPPIAEPIPGSGGPIVPGEVIHPGGSYFTDPGFSSCDSCGPVGCGQDGQACGSFGCVDCCNLRLPCFYGWQVFASYLYVRPRNAEVAYAVPVEEPLASSEPPVQVGRTGVADLNHQSGFRVGVGLAWNQCTSLRAQYTQVDATDPDQIETSAPNVLIPLVSHPSLASVNDVFLRAAAANQVAFEFFDLELRRTFFSRDRFTADWSAGIRYGHLKQEFFAEFSNLAADTIQSELDFDGVGFRFGLEIDRRVYCGFSLYGAGAASFLAGEFNGRFFQGSSTDETIVNTTWQAGRIVSILDVELGLAWTSYNGCWRFASGYLFNGWFNVVRNESFIDAVRRNNFAELSEGMGFDGFTFHGEIRF